MKILLGIVFTERERKEVVEEEEEVEGGRGRLGTRKLTPFEKEKERDKTPVIRSFLLQLLLEHE